MTARSNEWIGSTTGSYWGPITKIPAAEAKITNYAAMEGSDMVKKRKQISHRQSRCGSERHDVVSNIKTAHGSFFEFMLVAAGNATAAVKPPPVRFSSLS